MDTNEIGALVFLIAVGAWVLWGILSIRQS
jgi:hypothetical protein